MIILSKVLGRRVQTGFSIVTAVFLVVVLALLGVFIVSIMGLQQSTQALDVQGVRAYQAARAGIEWMAFQVLDPNNQLNPVPPGTCGNTVTCPVGGPNYALPALAGSLSAFSGTVTCTMTSTTEGNREIRVFAITSTASAGTPGTPGYVNRQIQATLTKCKDPTAAAPRCLCG